MAVIPETKWRRTFNFHCIYIGFARRRFQKKYCETYHTTLSDIVKAILQNGGHFQSNTSMGPFKCYVAQMGVGGVSDFLEKSVTKV